MVSACTLQHHPQIHVCSLLTCKKHQFAPTRTFLNLSNTFFDGYKAKEGKVNNYYAHAVCITLG